ncbi:thiosulfate reductase cytochrome b subunit [Microbacterium trichothecenolyticum]|uniref:cytochrome b/b6 domain-containing protein n=1 Tax=Microbacterium trichothecenolyticum TaxID=69370 RepID=UPI0028641567|nr:cytochrome b/b6 domain-containing protein [Microbacterium trichothecenolyticum]MDR7113169.1 thiosulfate reductase cytochrome b subunit [Microbacterium trichothecenolyticum]
MATFGSSVRRGLPRVPGGEPWPPAGAAPGANGNGAGPAAEVAATQLAPQGNSDSSTPSVATLGHPVPQSVVAGAQEDAAPKVTAEPRSAVTLRRGLPRVPGGEPWPPAGEAPVVPQSLAAGAETDHAPEVTAEQLGPDSAAVPQRVPATPRAAAPGSAPTAAGDGATALRRGLPRVAGGEPWPPAGYAPTATAAAVTDAEPPSVHEASAAVASGVAATVSETPAPAARTTATGVPLSEPLPFRRTVWAGATAKTHPAAKAEPKRIGPFTRGQWAGAVIVGGAGLLYAAGMAVFAVRWLLSTEWGVDFLAAYPGEYHLPEGAPVGIPAWLGWQHFFNVFLMVLIIRTGLQVRTEKRPSVFWSPRSNGRRKMSLNLWFHQSLDILWIVNGVIFVVLLFVTGQWMKIVPTSWAVFPNAVSAALQYVSLDWPTENGWVNYNSLQQLAYFATVFLAAPLAIATGVRMSHVWPKNATGLNKAYPVEWARAVHFPVMLYFVVFIAVHVFLVFATGALRNLNHMYAAQGSTDPNAYADNWTGFWFFVASLVVIAAAWVAARPLVLAPIARLFGKVSGR